MNHTDFEDETSTGDDLLSTLSRELMVLEGSVVRAKRLVHALQRVRAFEDKRKKAGGQDE